MANRSLARDDSRPDHSWNDLRLQCVPELRRPAAFRRNQCVSWPVSGINGNGHHRNGRACPPGCPESGRDRRTFFGHVLGVSQPHRRGTQWSGSDAIDRLRWLDRRRATLCPNRTRRRLAMRGPSGRATPEGGDCRQTHMLDVPGSARNRRVTPVQLLSSPEVCRPGHSQPCPCGRKPVLLAPPAHCARPTKYTSAQSRVFMRTALHVFPSIVR